jgi:hypothetical protein
VHSAVSNELSGDGDRVRGAEQVDIRRVVLRVHVIDADVRVHVRREERTIGLDAAADVDQPPAGMPTGGLGERAVTDAIDEDVAEFFGHRERDVRVLPATAGHGGERATPDMGAGRPPRAVAAGGRDLARSLPRGGRRAG